MSVQIYTDEQGHKKSVLIPYEEYQHMLDLLEELQDIRDYDERMASLDTDNFDDVKDWLRVQD